MNLFFFKKIILTRKLFFFLIRHSAPIWKSISFINSVTANPIYLFTWSIFGLWIFFKLELSSFTMFLIYKVMQVILRAESTHPSSYMHQN